MFHSDFSTRLCFTLNVTQVLLTGRLTARVEDQMEFRFLFLLSVLPSDGKGSQARALHTVRYTVHGQTKIEVSSTSRGCLLKECNDCHKYAHYLHFPNWADFFIAQQPKHTHNQSWQKCYYEYWSIKPYPPKVLKSKQTHSW